MATEDENIHHRVLNSVVSIIPDLPFDVTPPEIAQHVYTIVAHITGNNDPCHEAKQRDNQFALSLYPHFKEAVTNSSDSLLAASKLAIAGNSMDLGPQSSYSDFDSMAELALVSPLAIDDYEEFKRNVENKSHILYLGDNAGEIVFDRILIEELRQIKDFEIYFVVREKPIINDATLHDAISIGIDKVAKIVSSGCSAPGTILSQCSRGMLELYQSADIIIAKGQGNYESLSDETKNIFFLLKAKCPIVAKPLGINVGDAILKRGA